MGHQGHAMQAGVIIGLVTWDVLCAQDTMRYWHEYCQCAGLSCNVMTTMLVINQTDCKQAALEQPPETGSGAGLHF